MPFRASSKLIRTPTLIIAICGGVASYGAYRWHSHPSETAHLNPTTFTPYTLVAKQPVSSTSSIFTLRPPGGRSSPPRAAAAAEAPQSHSCIWSVQVKQPQLQIARSYTPLPSHSSGSGNGDGDGGDIRLLIRREARGEVSGYLHRLPLRATLEVRGPAEELHVPEAVADVLVLAGGTGIAPALQVADVLSRRSGARCTILWASRRREECVGGGRRVSQGLVSGWRSLFGLEENVVAEEEEVCCADKGVIVQELEALKKKAEGRLQVKYFVDEEKTYIRPACIREHLKHSQSAQGVQEGGQKLILVSGPDGFIEHWAGKKVWVGGQEAQGPLGGVLRELDLKDWRVWKL